jgi:hypothetical protein
MQNHRRAVRQLRRLLDTRVEAEISRLTTYGTKSDPDHLRESQQRLEILKITDMALIVSPGL